MSHVCYRDLQREVTVLLSQINRLPQHVFTKELKRIYAKDDVAGPLACALLFRQMKKVCPASEEKFWDSQIEACARASKISLKIRRGWEPFGEESAYDVVFPKRKPQIPRYHSEPILR